MESTMKLDKSAKYREKDHHRLPESNSACSIASSAVFNQQGSLPGIGMDGSFTYVKKVFFEAWWKQGRDADVAVASTRVRLVIRLRAAITFRPMLSSNSFSYTCSTDSRFAPKKAYLSGKRDRPLSHPTAPVTVAVSCQSAVSGRAAWT